MEYIILSIAILLFGAIFVLFVKDEYKPKVCTLFTLVAALTAVLPAGYVLYKGNMLYSFIKMSSVFGNVSIVLDSLSAFFVIVISIISLISVIYANGYLKPYLNVNKNIHCSFLMLLIAAMMAVTIIQNGLMFLVAWEIMSLSSFFLVIYEGNKPEVLKAGIKYLVYMHISVVFLIAMFAVLTNSAGSLDFDQYINVLVSNQKLANIIFTLGFIGFGIKAGFVPFHTWLPDAHPAAPSHVSALMSGIMIKTGIYGILRLLFMIQKPSAYMGYLVLIVAVISALYGVLYAITQHDIKRLLAYHSIENIGIIGIGIGAGMLGITYGNQLVAVLALSGGLLHILNHAIFKQLLFMAAGGVYLKTHTRNIEDMGGLIKKMPYTGFLFIIGSAAIAGLPVFNGFISEFLVYAGMLLSIPASGIQLFITMVISIAALAMVGTMAILCFTKVSGIMFLGNPRSERAVNVKNDVSAIMLLPMGVLATLTLLIGLFPQFFISIVLPSIAQMASGENTLEILRSTLDLTKQLSWIMILFVVLTIIIFVVKSLMTRYSQSYTTWGCGYENPNPHMQYTASSYANPFVSTLKPLFKRISKIKKPKELFPKEAYFELEIEDIEEAYIVEPIIKLDEKILTKFERIQNGNMQQYILLGLIFLVAAIVCLIVFGG